MRYLKLLLAGLKKQKGSLIGIFLLMFIISVSLGSVITIKVNSTTYIHDEMNRLGIGDILYWTYQVPDIYCVKKEIESVSGTKQVKIEKVLMANVTLNGTESNTKTQGSLYDATEEYQIYNDDLSGYLEKPEELETGEIYVPISYVSIFNAKVGDILHFKSSTGIIEKTYTIKGFFEDPLMGSSMMGIKRFFMTQEDMQDFISEANDKDQSIDYVYLYHVYAKDSSPSALRKLQNAINKESTIDNYVVLSYQCKAMNGFMMLLQNIFFGFLVAFVSVLLMIAFIVIGHSISSGIEQDYVDMGILKAVGFQNTDLILVQIMQYLIVVILGLLCGIGFAPLVVTLVNQLTITVTGIEISNVLPMGIYFICFGIIVILMTLFISVKVAAIGKITPISAIREAKKDVFFNSRIHTTIHKSGMGFWLGMRSFETGKKQYISVCVITVLMVFFLSLCGRLQAWLGPNGEGLLNTMGTASVNGRSYDFAIQYEDDDMKEKAEQIISKYTDTIVTYQSGSARGQVNYSDYLLSIISTPEYLHIVEGRTCTYDNEIVITKVVASETGLQVGDKAIVTVGDCSLEFIVSGLNQCANDMGANFAMSREAYIRFVSEDAKFYENYIIEKQDMEETILDEIEDQFGSKVVIDENTWSGVDGIVTAANSLEMMMYVICAIFVVVVISLTGSRILYKEQHDLGIFRSLGFQTKMLRVAFAVRFGVVAIFGAVLGIIISVLLTDTFVGFILENVGVGEFASNLSVLEMLKPVVCVIIFFIAFAYLCAGKIKKTDVGVLIVE